MNLSKVNLKKDRNSSLSFLLLPLLLLFYLVIEFTNGVDSFTLLLLHIAFLFLFQSWKLRNIAANKYLYETIDDNFDAGNFLSVLLKNVFGWRSLFFLLHLTIIVIFYQNIVSSEIVYFMLLTYVYALFIDAPSFLAAIKSRRQYKNQSTLFGFLGSAILTSTLVQQLYFGSIERLLLDNLLVINCVLLYAVPLLVATSFYSYRMTMLKESLK